MLKKLKTTIDKKGEANMMAVLAALAIGIVTFGLIVVVGSIVVQNTTAATGCQNVLGLNNEATTYNLTDGTCRNGSSGAGALALGANQAGISGAYLLTQLGSSSGGLASWTPAIIAVAIGALFLSLFAGGFIGKKE